MTADISSLLRLLSSYNGVDRTVAKESTTTPLMTRDLLGSGSRREDRSLELDLDLQVPTGFEKRLDLKSGKVYLQRCNSTTTSSSSITESENSNHTHDLNFPANKNKPLLNLFDDKPPSPPSSSRSNLQSVCTLEKVKSALERAEKDRKRRSPEDDAVSDHFPAIGSSPVVAGCGGCLTYVLVMKSNPKCPRCETIVHLPEANAMKKKPKIDLNISI